MLSHHVQNVFCERQKIWIFFMVTLSFQKSIQIFNFPFFLQTTTIREIQVVSSIWFMNLDAILFYDYYAVRIHLVPTLIG